MLTTLLHLVPKLRMSVAVHMRSVRFNLFSSTLRSEISSVYDAGRKGPPLTPVKKKVQLYV